MKGVLKMTYEKRKELEKFSMGSVGSRDVYKNKRKRLSDEEKGSWLTYEEFRQMEEFINKKVNDYVRSVFYPKTEEIINMVKPFRNIRVIGRQPQEITNFDLVRIDMVDGVIIVFGISNEGIEVLECSKVKEGFPYTMSDIDYIIENHVGIKRIDVRASNIFLWN